MRRRVWLVEVETTDQCVEDAMVDVLIEQFDSITVDYDEGWCLFACCEPKDPVHPPEDELRRQMEAFAAEHSVRVQARFATHDVP